MKTIALLCVLALTGCAHFTTTQKEVRNEQDTTITTKVSCYTIFSSKSELAKFSAKQSQASQSAEVGSLSQQGGTNAVQVLEAIAKIVGALPK